MFIRQTLSTTKRYRDKSTHRKLLGLTQYRIRKRRQHWGFRKDILTWVKQFCRSSIIWWLNKHPPLSLCLLTGKRMTAYRDRMKPKKISQISPRQPLNAKTLQII